MTRIPSLRNTSSKEALNLLSRSLTRNRAPLKQLGEAEVAGLLGDPAAGRIRGAACEVDAPAADLEKEEHVEAAERDRFDREEITREHAGPLLAQERPPVQLGTPRRGLEASSREHSPNCARRNREAELQQLAGDPLIAPPRVLARKPQTPVLAARR
jgi:hypothetical protein